MAVTETVTIAARIPTQLAEDLNALAERNERSSSAEVRLALKAHLAAAGKPKAKAAA